MYVEGTLMREGSKVRPPIERPETPHPSADHLLSMLDLVSLRAVKKSSVSCLTEPADLAIEKPSSTLTLSPSTPAVILAPL